MYGYDHSSEILRAMGQEFVEEHRAFTAFDCKENTSIWSNGPKTNGKSLKNGPQ